MFVIVKLMLKLGLYEMKNFMKRDAAPLQMSYLHC